MSRAKQVEALRAERRRLLRQLHLTGEHSRQLLEEVQRLTGIVEAQRSQMVNEHAELFDAVHGALHAACMPVDAKPAVLVDVVERLMVQVAKAGQGRHAV